MNDNIQKLLVLAVSLGGCFGLLAYASYAGYTETTKEVIYLVVGFAISKISTIIDYYFGSSRGSDKKTDAMLKNGTAEHEKNVLAA